MGLLHIAAAGAIGYVLYRYIQKEKHSDHVAFAAGEGSGPVRNAGPEGMRSDPPQWDEIDQASDASFPASDPPAAGKFT